MGFPYDPRFRKIEFSLNVFDVDLAYLFTDAIFEADGLLIMDDPIGGIFLLEKPSKDVYREEWSKVPIRQLVSVNTPLTVWWGDENRLNSLSRRLRIYRFREASTKKFRGNVEQLYEFFPEMMNLFFYSLLFIAKEYRNSLREDFIRVGKGCELGDSLDFLELFIKFMEEGWNKYKDLIENLIQQRESLLKKVLATAKVWAILPQLGLGGYRVEAIAQSIGLLYSKLLSISKTMLRDVILVTNRDLRQRFPREISDLECSLREQLPTSINVYQRDFNDLIGSISKNEKSEIIFILMQDWNKELLATLLEKEFRILVIPETFYIYVKSTQSKRRIEAKGRYLRDLKNYDKEFWKILALKVSIVGFDNDD